MQTQSLGSLLPIATFAAAVVGLLVSSLLRRRAGASIAGRADPRLVMAIVVSGVVLLAALYVILSRRYSLEEQRWAFTAVGTILGYWLRT